MERNTRVQHPTPNMMRYDNQTTHHAKLATDSADCTTDFEVDIIE
jgi:hypothetical protein